MKTTVSSAAITQASVPAPRRPSGSIRAVMKNRPTVLNTTPAHAAFLMVWVGLSGIEQRRPPKTERRPAGLRQTGQATDTVRKAGGRREDHDAGGKRYRDRGPDEHRAKRANRGR